MCSCVWRELARAHLLPAGAQRLLCWDCGSDTGVKFVPGSTAREVGDRSEVIKQMSLRLTICETGMIRGPIALSQDLPPS